MRGLRMACVIVADGGEIALGGHGETGLDDVHAQVFKGMRHGELFLRGHAATGRLFAIAQSGVEERLDVIRMSSCSPAGEDLANSFSFSHRADIRQSYSFWVTDYNCL